RYSRNATSPLIIEAAEGHVSDAVAKCKRVVSIAIEAGRTEGNRWATELIPWDSLISAIVAEFGECPAASHLATVAAGIKSPTETCTDCPDLFDHSKSLCRRARYARLRA